MLSVALAETPSVSEAVGVVEAGMVDDGESGLGVGLPLALLDADGGFESDGVPLGETLPDEDAHANVLGEALLEADAEAETLVEGVSLVSLALPHVQLFCNELRRLRPPLLS